MTPIWRWRELQGSPPRLRSSNLDRLGVRSEAITSLSLLCGRRLCELTICQDQIGLVGIVAPRDRRCGAGGPIGTERGQRIDGTADIGPGSAPGIAEGHELHVIRL